VKRIFLFLRSVLPRDATQLLFVAGILCLVVARHLRWWPEELFIDPSEHAGVTDQEVRGYATLGLLPIMFAALAGYFVCFRPGNHPIRRILCAVYAPAIAGMAIILTQILYFGKRHSILESVDHPLVVSGFSSWFPWKLPLGFEICLLGLLLMTIYTSRLVFGIAAMPLSLPGEPISRAENQGLWGRVQLLIWVMMGPLFLVDRSLSLVLWGIPNLISSPLSAYLQSVWPVRFATLLDFPVVLGVVLWVMGKEGRQIVRNTVRLPAPKWFGLALALPIGISIALSSGQYLVDRASWAAHNFGRYEPPRFSAYFDFPDGWLLLLIFSAFFEELVFRGFLQNVFIKRYGIFRGIFLVGIVWSVSHFESDFYFSRLTVEGVLTRAHCTTQLTC